MEGFGRPMGQDELYGEVILFINLIMNYAILWLTSKFANITASKKRIFLGSFVGALYSLALFLPNLSYLISTIGKLLFSLLILLVTFAPVKPKKFLATFGYFYLVSFSLIGIVIGLSYFINNNANAAQAYNELLRILNTYFWFLLLVALLVGFTVGKVIPALIKKKVVRNLFQVPIIISFGKETIQVEALIDTGNSLRDPISQMPVIIVEYVALSDILPPAIRQVFNGGGEPEIDKILGLLDNTSWTKRLRLIPFSSLGRNNGMLIAFRPDYVEINTGDETIITKNIVVGIHQRPLCPEGSYHALLHPDILQKAFS